MDEYREPVQGVIFEMPKIAADAASTTPISGSSTSPMKTFSMLNWDTPYEQMPAAFIGPLKKETPTEVVEDDAVMSFYIDNEAIFVPISEEYFVVI
jgi:hypothetical protein